MGNRVYFPSRQGWLACDGYNVVPIGYEKVDGWWDGQIDLSKTELLSRAHAPQWKSIVWSTPTSADYPSQLLGYNYELNQWWTLVESIDWLVRLSPYGLSLDETPYATKSMDAASPDLGTTNLDTLTASQDELLAFFDHSTGKLRTWSDTNNANRKFGILQTLDMVGPSPSRRYFVQWGRPHFNETEDVSGSIQMNVQFRNQLSDNREDVVIYRTMNAYGTCAIRDGGRYGSIWMRAFSGVERLLGVELKITEEGRR